MAKQYLAALRGYIYDPVTGITVRIGRFISERTNFAKQTLFSSTYQKTANGATYSLSLGFEDVDNRYQLELWAQSRTPVMATLILQDGNAFLWHEPVSIICEQLTRFNSRDGFSPMTLEMYFVGQDNALGLDGGAKIMSTSNILFALYNWGASTFTGLPQGAGGTSGNYTSAVLSGGIFTLTSGVTTPNTIFFYYRDIIAPIAGEFMTLACDYAGASGVPPSQVGVLIEFYTITGVYINGFSNLLNGSSPGRSTVRFTVPANTYVIRCYPVYAVNVPLSTQIEINSPSLRFGTNAAFTRY